MKAHKDLKYIGTLEGVYYFREVDGSVVTGTESDMEKLFVITAREEIRALSYIDADANRCARRRPVIREEPIPRC